MAVAHRSTFVVNVALALVSTLLAVLLVEIVYRAAMGLPVFRLINWRVEQVSLIRLRTEHVRTDPVLGWTNASWVTTGNFLTIDHGIRRNFDESEVRTGAVLVVGDSFTEGWEVPNHQSWPAVLEETTGTPVINAGVGAYGSDQIILRAEQLLPIVQPKVLIIGFLQDDIQRAGYSRYGAPKPYFTIEDGALRYHPPEPLEPRDPGGVLSWIAYTLRDPLGYFATAEHLFARLNRDYWYGTESQMYRTVDTDEVAVTCALLTRLAEQTGKAGVRVALFMQYDARYIVATQEPRPETEAVIGCARNLGMRIADQFSFLRGVAGSSHDPMTAMRQYYLFTDGVPGHMSARGNRHAAQLLARELRDWLEGLPGAQ